MTSEVVDTERDNTSLGLGRAVSTASRRKKRTQGGSFDPKGRGLLMLRLPVTAFSMVPISRLLHYAAGKQTELPSTSPDRYARQFLKSVRVLKRDGRKTLPK